MRHAFIYLVAGHVALIALEALAFVATNEAAILDVFITTTLAATVLHVVAFILRKDRGISTGRLVVRGGLTTLACLPIWFLAFLVLSWVTADSILALGLVFFVPLSAVSSGLVAVLGLGFRRGEPTF